MSIQNFNFSCCLYGCKNWYLILREEHEVKVFDNLVTIKILEPKGGEYCILKS